MSLQSIAMEPIISKLVVKSDTPDEHLVYGEVYAPNRLDADHEFMRADEIKKMAHAFMRSGGLAQIDVQHNNKVVVGCSVVESFIAQKGDLNFLPDAWVVGVHIPDEDLWQDIKKGDINGFSMEALVTRHPQTVEVEIPPVVSGMTSKSEDHDHQFFVGYDNEGFFRGGRTDVVNGHFHNILHGTHTETVNGHSHRFSSVDTVSILGT
jgi:hypothetical protein